MFMHLAAPPRPPFPQIELRDVIGVSAKNNTTGRRIPGRVVCSQRAFWLLAEGEEPRRIVHTDPRKERKF
jgi:hypothetical protein